VAKCKKKNARLIGVVQSRAKIFCGKLWVLADSANHRFIVRNTRSPFHVFSVLVL
jgi:hypothetical protein